jgi:hypothetical protein
MNLDPDQRTPRWVRWATAAAFGLSAAITIVTVVLAVTFLVWVWSVIL